MVITSFLISSSKVATVLLDTPVRNNIIFIIRTISFLIKSENKNKAFNSIYQFKIYIVRIYTILIPYH